MSRPVVATCCDGSLGAASLGANREAPAPRRAPSVRSDERPLATQGDMLNSIKLQRRLRDSFTTDKTAFHEKTSMTIKKPSIRSISPRMASQNKPSITQTPDQVSGTREKPKTIRSFFGPQRPMSPIGRRNTQTTSFF